MAHRRNPLIRWVLTTLALALIKGGGLLPLSVVRAFGSSLGRLAYYVVPRVKSVGMANLDLAYGDTLTRAEKVRILKSACRNFGMVFVEFSHVPKSRRYLDEGLIRAEGMENLDFTRGFLAISGHIGNWELGAIVFAQYDVQPIGIVRSFDDPRLDDVICNIRRAAGFDPLPKNAAGPELIRLLRNGKVAVILVDQSTRTNGVPVTFFGQPCWATVAPAMIALRTKVPIHLSCCIRNNDGTFTVKFTPAIETERTGNFREDLVRVTQDCQNALEEMVREHPEQWLWMHRRWKKRPNLEKEWNDRLARDKKPAHDRPSSQIGNK